MERKIGEIFECNGEWYQCIRSSDCPKCDLKIITNCRFKFPCESLRRDDCEEVIFKKLEKIGEIYSENGRIFQKYKVHKPVVGINEDELNTIIAIEIKQKEEGMEEKKLNLKPFDIQKAREGKPVCTRDGRKARIICFDMNSFNNHIIVALITEENGTESIYSYTSEGKWKEIKTENDLMMLPEKKEGWVNLYKSSAYPTKEEAMKYRNKCNDYIDTIKITWEE